MSGTAIKTAGPFKGPRALGRAAKVAGELPRELREGRNPGGVGAVAWEGVPGKTRESDEEDTRERERGTEANGSLRLPDNANSARAHTAEKIRERTSFVSWRPRG